jgi:replicative DNA helicase
MKRYSDGLECPNELTKVIGDYSSSLARIDVIEGTAKLRAEDVAVQARTAMEKWGKHRCLVVVDYLQRWAAGRREQNEFRHVVSGLVTEIRELSHVLDSPVILISSQNRTGQGSSTLVSLKESGDIEYAADSVMFLVEEKKKRPLPPARYIDLMVEKNRYGDRGSLRLLFRPDVGIFQEEVK